jgi:hypothetical protein
MSQASGQSPTTDEASSIGRRLRWARRRNRGWSQSRLVHEIREVGRKHNKTTPTAHSLTIMLSGWENDRAKPDQYNRRLLVLALESDPAALGLDLDPDHNWYPNGDF